MAGNIKKYRISKRQLERAYKSGFEAKDGGALECKDSGPARRIFFSRFDGGEDSCPWGRLVFDAEVREDTVYTVLAFASDDTECKFGAKTVDIDSFLLNPETKNRERLKLFEGQGALEISGQSDLLLYGQNGRYLWLALIVQGGDAVFSDFRIYVPGDNFFRTFPEVYRSDGEFFHRYISIFSSIYNDLQEKIDTIDKLLDIDSTPAELLPIYASWFGIQGASDYMTHEQLRALLKIAFPLIREKGTCRAIEDALKVLIDEPFYIVEQHKALKTASGSERRNMERLYGQDPFCFTVLLARKPDEKLAAALHWLLGQFKPLRAKLRFVFLEGSAAALDFGAYADVNASLLRTGNSALERESCLDDMNYMK